jgi:hypothetical protein
MLDADLAQLYGVETRVLDRGAGLAARFPEPQYPRAAQAGVRRDPRTVDSARIAQAAHRFRDTAGEEAVARVLLLVEQHLERVRHRKHIVLEIKLRIDLVVAHFPITQHLGVNIVQTELAGDLLGPFKSVRA